MFTIKLSCENKHGYIAVKEYEIPYPYNQINHNKNPDKKIYYSLESYTVKNIKGKFFIHFAKKIDLNDKKFVSGTNRIKVDGGWITNTSKPNRVEGQNLQIYSFKPILASFKSIINLARPFHDLDILGVSKSIIQQKIFLFYLSDNPSDYSTARNDKFSFPLYLIRSFNDIINNFQFFMTYEDESLGNFINEEVILRIKLYDENEID